LSENKISAELLAERVAWSLDRKIQESWHRMEQFYNWCRVEGKTCSLSFSGGLDSTVMLHLMRSNPFLKTAPIPVYFADTGIEYPEIREFVKSTPGVEWVRSDKKFKEIIDQYGYPIISKKTSYYLHELQQTKSAHMVKLRLTGWRKDGTHSPMGCISKKWQFLVGAPFKVSHRCCDFMKKRPMKCAGCPFIGVRADEAKTRKDAYKLHGCNAYDQKLARSWPLAFWTEKDIRDYLAMHSVPYSPIYDMGYTSTGCYTCAFGLHLEQWPNRFQLMEKTHPRLWNQCMDFYGLQRILEFMNEWLPKKQRISFRYSDYLDSKFSGGVFS